MFDPRTITADFPLLSRTVRDGKSIHYLDNAATTQKPQVVIDSLTDFYSQHNGNIHRGVHTLSEEATEMFEGARSKVQKFIGARLPSEIVFTSGTTHGINLVAFSWGRANIKAGDEIVLTEMEHHANLIPWQILAKETGAVLKFIPMGTDFLLDLRNLKGIITEKTKLVCVVHASNFIGTLNDLDEITRRAREVGAKVLVDCAQSAPHLAINVQKLRADFLTFSSHKLLGPMGAGVLYIESETAKDMPPFMTGGGIIDEVSFQESTFQEPPARFEPGTPPVADIIGMGVAIDYLNNFDMSQVLEHERELVKYLFEKFDEIGDITIFGTRDLSKRIGVVAFESKGIHSHDLATVSDEGGVAIRSGQHCVQALHKKLGLADSARASFYLYNTREDVDALIEGILKARKILL